MTWQHSTPPAHFPEDFVSNPWKPKVIGGIQTFRAKSSRQGANVATYVLLEFIWFCPGPTARSPVSGRCLAELIRRCSRRIRLGIIARSRQHHSALDLWDSKVPAEMRQVNWTDRARNGNKVDLARSREQDGYVSDRSVIEPNPYVGRASTIA